MGIRELSAFNNFNKMNTITMVLVTCLVAVAVSLPHSSYTQDDGQDRIIFSNDRQTLPQPVNRLDEPYSDGHHQDTRPYNDNRRNGYQQDTRPYNDNRRNGHQQDTRPYNDNRRNGHQQDTSPYNDNRRNGHNQHTRPYNSNQRPFNKKDLTRPWHGN